MYTTLGLTRKGGVVTIDDIKNVRCDVDVHKKLLAYQCEYHQRGLIKGWKNLMELPLLVTAICIANSYTPNVSIETTWHAGNACTNEECWSSGTIIQEGTTSVPEKDPKASKESRLRLNRLRDPNTLQDMINAALTTVVEGTSLVGWYGHPELYTQTIEFTKNEEASTPHLLELLINRGTKVDSPDIFGVMCNPKRTVFINTTTYRVIGCLVSPFPCPCVAYALVIWCPCLSLRRIIPLNIGHATRKWQTVTCTCLTTRKNKPQSQIAAS